MNAILTSSHINHPLQSPSQPQFSTEYIKSSVSFKQPNPNMKKINQELPRSKKQSYAITVVITLLFHKSLNIFTLAAKINTLLLKFFRKVKKSNNKSFNLDYSLLKSNSNDVLKSFLSSTTKAVFSFTNQTIRKAIELLNDLVVGFRVGLNFKTIKSTKAEKTSSRNSSKHKKTLVLDLDETLIHCSQIGSKNPDYMIEVFIDKHAKLYYVYKRPHVDEFLKTVSKWYNIAIFTSAHEEYANSVLNKIDQEKKIFKTRLYRESCSKIKKKTTFYAKDITLIEKDLKKVFLVDNNIDSFELNKSIIYISVGNAVPITTWTNNDANDEALLDLLPFLESLRHVKDVRSILSLREIE